MKRAAFIILALFMVNHVFADDRGQQKTPHIFTDQDLNRYKKSSDTYKLQDKTESTGVTVDEKDTLSDTGGEVQKLRQYRIPYRAYEGIAMRIIIPVTLNGSVTANMALDTGSPGMIISDMLANKLGIFEKDDGKLMTIAAGIGGYAPAILTIIDTVQVEGAEDHFIPTIITRSLSNAFEGLIGMDFMANYSIKIDTRRHFVVFEELPQRPNMPAGHDRIWWKTYFRSFATMRAEWKNYRESLDKKEGDPQKLNDLKKFADRQYREADKLFNRLNGYAVRHAVPMSWREY